MRVACIATSEETKARRGGEKRARVLLYAERVSFDHLKAKNQRWQCCMIGLGASTEKKESII